MTHAKHPESLMMSYGYNPDEAQGSIKSPLYQTSTFEFKTAEEGKAYFEVAYGLREPNPEEKMGMIYSRLNNPNLDILEKRLTLWDKAEAAAVFESGMSAISTVMLEFLKPGDVLLYSNPTYGGTDHFIHHYLPSVGVEVIGFKPWQSEEEIIAMLQAQGKTEKLAMVYVETPANPTNHLVDIEMCSRIAKRFSSEDQKIVLAVDNTYMGPLWQHPIQHGADLVLYSATKYIGGHSDLIAGAVLGSEELIARVKVLRTFLGNMASPHTCWLLLRSLETLKVRMDQQVKNAEKVAKYLLSHSKVENVRYLGFLDHSSSIYPIYKKQCLSAGAMLSFDIIGGEKEAFQFLNNLRLIKLAVSLGSTESLAQHPKSMTHAGVEPEQCYELGVTDKMVRLSIGVENAEDIIGDIANALSKVKMIKEELVMI